MSDIVDELSARLREDGWQVITSDTVVEAERAVILAKWLLGSRRIHLKLKCRFDLAAHAVHYQETAREVVRGLPPPTLSLVSSRQRGLEVNETRRDVSFPEGGGEMHYGEVRQWLQSHCAEAGWTFILQV